MFYDILQGLCRERGLTVSAALKIMGISCGNMAHWRAGRTPNGKTLRRMARFFDVPADHLVAKRPNLYAAQQEKLLELFGAVEESDREAALRDVETVLTPYRNKGATVADT